MLLPTVMPSTDQGCPASNPFDQLPSDILCLIYDQLGDDHCGGLQALSALGRTSPSNRALHETLALPTYLNQHYPLHRQLELSPLLASTSAHPPPSSSPWTPSAITKHLHTASRRVSTREFVARPLPLPAATSKAKRVAALRPLLAVGDRRVVCAGVGGRRATLVVYELGERKGDQGIGERVVGEGWEVGFGPGVGVRDGEGGERRERQVGGGNSDGDVTPPRAGTGGLLSNDLTGLEFFSSPIEGADESEEETTLLLTFANGVIQTVRLPSLPPSSPLHEPLNKFRRNRIPKPSPSSVITLSLVTLLRTYPHPPSPIQSLSISPSYPSTFLTTSYSSLLTLHTSLTTSTTLDLPSTQTPWSSLLHDSSKILIGTSTSLLYYPSPTHTPRSLLSPENTSATYAIHAHPLNPHLILSAHSHPLSCIVLHDLRVPTAGETPGVRRCVDPWTEESWYSVSMSSDGRTVVGGTGGGGRVGFWDLRSSTVGGWTAFAPVSPSDDARGSKQGAGEVGKLVWKGAGRVWGVTPSSPFLMDFSESSRGEGLYPPMGMGDKIVQQPRGGGTKTSVFKERDPGIVSWYAHAGEKVRPGVSQGFV